MEPQPIEGQREESRNYINLQFGDFSYRKMIPKRNSSKPNANYINLCLDLDDEIELEPVQIDTSNIPRMLDIIHKAVTKREILKRSATKKRVSYAESSSEGEHDEKDDDNEDEPSRKKITNRKIADNQQDNDEYRDEVEDIDSSSSSENNEEDKDDIIEEDDGEDDDINPDNIIDDKGKEELYKNDPSDEDDIEDEEDGGGEDDDINPGGMVDDKGKEELDGVKLDDDFELEPMIVYNENPAEGGDEEVEEEEVEEEEVEEDEVEEEEVEDQPRRSSRNRTKSPKEAFEMLRNGDIDGFLDEWIIQKHLAPAFHLLNSEFNSGHNAGLMTNLWRLHWSGNLYVVSLGRVRHRGQCVACKRRRQLKYCMYNTGDRIDLAYFDNLANNMDQDEDDEEDDDHDEQEDDHDGEEDNDEDEEFLGIMGTDCYEIKFNPLMNLADACMRLTLQLHRDDFNNYALEYLGRYIETVREAPARMKSLYSRKR